MHVSHERKITIVSNSPGFWHADLLVLAFFASFHVFEIVAKVLWQAKSYGVLLAKAPFHGREQASWLPYLQSPPGFAPIAVPFSIRWMTRVDWRIEASEVEGARAAVATQEFTVATTSNTRVYILSLKEDISHGAILADLWLMAEW